MQPGAWQAFFADRGISQFVLQADDFFLSYLLRVIGHENDFFKVFAGRQMAEIETSSANQSPDKKRDENYV